VVSSDPKSIIIILVFEMQINARLVRVLKMSGIFSVTRTRNIQPEPEQIGQPQQVFGKQQEGIRPSILATLRGSV
jgi:hypothetical protein